MLASDFHRHQPNTALTASTPPQWGLKRTVFIVYLAQGGTAVFVETAEVDPARSCSFHSVWNRLCVLFTCLTSHKRFKTETKNTSEPLYQGSTSTVSTETAVPLSAKYTMEYCTFWPLRARETGGRLTISGLGAALRDGANHPVTR